MLKDSDKLLVDALENDNKSLVQRYLQNPFSVAWSKLVAWMKPTPTSEAELLEGDRFEEYKRDSSKEGYLYHPFTDHVDPSLYYTIFSLYKRF